VAPIFKKTIIHKFLTEKSKKIYQLSYITKSDLDELDYFVNFSIKDINIFYRKIKY